MGYFSKLGAALVLVSAQLAAIPSTATAVPADSASADQNGELREFCYDLIASGEYEALSLGECMSFNLTPDAGWRAHVCDLFRETTGFGEGQDFSSYSDCVRTVY